MKKSILSKILDENELSARMESGWVNPDKLANLGITIPEIINAIRAQNTVNPAGQIGAEPVPPGQKFTYSVSAPGRLPTAEEFGQIIIRAQPDGSVLRLNEVARIELGAQSYSVVGRLNSKPAAIVAVYQAPGSNAVKTAAAVRSVMEDAKTRFPPDLHYVVALDTTLAVTSGIKEIESTIVEAMVLVIIVVFSFPTELESNSHPAACSASFPHRHIHSFPAARLFYQYALALRHGAGNWTCSR
jgi:hydrophobic/amphiphilic exporter-1 (mainly G- bacteria), HAE1 family